MLGQLKQCLAQFSGGLIASQLCVPLLQFQVKPVVIVIFFIKLNAIIGLFALDAALIFFNKNLPFTGDERYSIYYLYLKINKYVIDLNLFFNEALIVFFYITQLRYAFTSRNQP